MGAQAHRQAAQHSIIMPPSETNAMPYQRVLQFYKEPLLPLVQTKAVDTHTGISTS